MEWERSLLPSVEELIQNSSDSSLCHRFQVPLAREILEKARQAHEAPSQADLESQLKQRSHSLLAPSLRRAINATGVLLHTNLGRAPLGKEALEALQSLESYCTLEIEAATGARSDRTKTIESLMELVLGCEKAAVVNNNAAAVYLFLAHWARGKEVIVSRGEMVQIGGGFRVPEILESSGAILREVGTTNITRIGDFERAINSNTALILRIHPSNFTINGHHEMASLKEIGELSRKTEIPFFVDLGDGFLGSCSEDLSLFRALHAGACGVCLSGDKAFGGPQAGILVGQKRWVGPLKKNPLYRVLRLGKLEIFLLEWNLRRRLCGEPIPIEQRWEESEEEVKKRALRCQVLLGPDFDLIKEFSVLGGGVSPRYQKATWCLRWKGEQFETFAKKLRQSHPAIFCRVQDGILLFDLRTVFPEEEELLIGGIRKCLS